MKKVLVSTVALLLAATVAQAIPITVANSVGGITDAAAAADGTTGVLLTTTDFDMSGGNAVAFMLTSEAVGGSSVLSATFAGQTMNVVNASQSPQSATIFYLLNPSTTVGAFEVTVDAGLSGPIAYSQISLANVAGLVGFDTANSTSTANGTPLDLSYTTTTDGGFVLGAAANNDYTGSRALSIAYGNPDTALLSHVNVGSSGHFHTYGDIAVAGTYTDGYYGQYQRTAISTVAFEAIPEPATLGLIAAMGGGILVIRRLFMM